MSIKKLLVAINAKYIHSNLAVYSLKAYCENAPYNIENVHIAEYTINNRVEEIIDDIYMLKPKMLAFSCYIWNIDYVCKIIIEINKLLPDCHIWLGGPEVSYNTDYYLDTYKFIQGIMVGEGEETFGELAQCYDRNEVIQIKGIVTHNKRVVDNRDFVDMSKIPFTYKDLSVFENRIIYYESSRGCPYSCSYCLSCIDKKLRFRDIDLVKKELQFFIDNKVKQVKFIDRTFNCNRDRALTIWQYILEHDNHITNFHFEISSDLLDDEQVEVINKMRVGLVQLEIGVQSTNERTLSAIKRKMDMHKLEYMVSRLREKKNIHIHLDLIAGLPYEDLESFKKSFNDVYNMKPDELQLGFLKVLHGAYMYEDAKKYGIVYKSFPPYEVLYTPWLSYDEVLTLKKIEEVLEVYYGSGQFVYSVKYLESFFNSPYDFYHNLGEFFSEALGGQVGSKHSRIERYNILLSFARNYKAAIDEKILTELMTLDIYLRENIKSRPLFSKDLECYREEIKALAREKNISKNNHIEVFSKEVIKYAREVFGDGIGEATLSNIEEVFVSFNYECRNSITNNAGVEMYVK